MKLFLVAILLLLASIATANFKKNVKRTHNRFRKKHGVANLKWDSDLEQYAQKRCEEVAETGSYESKEDNPYGENFEKSWGSSSFQAGKKAVEEWYGEGTDYDYDNPGYSAATKQFTQVVWRSTESFGCGSLKKGSSTWVCCAYFPPGNVPGKYKDNVFDPLK